MTIFLRILGQRDMAEALEQVVYAVRTGADDKRIFDVALKNFGLIPGSPLSYWVSDDVRSSFAKFPPFESDGRTVKIGMKTGDDFRFLRLWWEVSKNFIPYAKGGPVSSFYGDIPTSVNWKQAGAEVKAFVTGRMRAIFGASSYEFWISNEDFYFRPGMTWSLRGASFSPRALPAKCIFSVRGYAAFVCDNDEMASLAIMNSSAFDYLFKCALGRFAFPEFIVGILQKIPFVFPNSEAKDNLSSLAHRGWSLRRMLDSSVENSHAFSLPLLLQSRFGQNCSVPTELDRIQAEIDSIAFDLYGFGESDRQAVSGTETVREPDDDGDEDENEEAEPQTPSTDALLSWAIGVSFGRFDVRLATGGRALPPEPEPFDPLPAKSPGMVPDGDQLFHANSGILVDDVGDPHDLPNLIDAILDQIGIEVGADARLWLRRDFFPLHLSQYSKSRRKAPIYWPLSTASGSYTLWLYYPALTDQTLFVAANDFIGTKSEREVEPALRALRQKSGRSREEERELENLQTLHDELRTLREELLRLAPTWKPNHDDGVQVTAAPLWRLFRHRPWQTVLRDTWEKLEAGNYDWSHLAMTYWPNRVRDKCRTDKSLAIAHDLEHLCEPPPEAPPKARRGSRKKG